MRIRLPLTIVAPAIIVLGMIVTVPRDKTPDEPVTSETGDMFDLAIGPGDFDVPIVHVRSSARDIVVGSGGVASLTEAVSIARDGDRIVIRGGVHTDVPLIIESSIEIIGEDGAILDGQDREGILTVRAPNVRISGITFRNTGVSHVRDHAAVLLEKGAWIRHRRE
jgi:hypothetical protein